jgi:hypothetical protein
MSRKNNLRAFQNIVNGDMSQASITSAVTDIQFLDNIGFQFNFTGTPVGTFSIEVSIDYAQDFNGNVLNAGNWVPVNLMPVPVASGAAGSVYVDLHLVSFPWIRAVYTRTSGSGTLNGFISAKMI